MDRQEVNLLHHMEHAGDHPRAAGLARAFWLDGQSHLEAVLADRCALCGSCSKDPIRSSISSFSEAYFLISRFAFALKVRVTLTL